MTATQELIERPPQSEPIHPVAGLSVSSFFELPLRAEEKTQGHLCKAICLRFAFLSLFAYCLYSAAATLMIGIPLLGNQRENTYPEAPQAYAAVRSALSGKLYYAFTTRPYAAEPYGPLYYEMNYWIARIEHADLDRFVHSARAINMVFFVLCGVLVFVICRRLRFSLSAALAAATLPFGVPFFSSWVATIRPDIFCLALMLASLLIAIWNDSPSGWACIASGVIGGLAVLMKQPGIAVLIAIGAVWLIRKKFRETTFLVLGAAVPAILMLAFLLLRKEDFVGQFLAVSRSVWSLTDGLSYTLAVLKTPTVFLPIMIGVLGFARALAAGERAQLLASFALVNWVVGLSGMPQSGAAGNYFFGGLLGCGLLLPFAVELIREKVKLAPILLLMAVGLCYLMMAYSVRGTIPATNFAHNAYQGLQSFRILSDRPEFSLHGREPELLDPISMHMLELGSGAWSSAPIEEGVRKLDYDMVILACSGGSRLICSFRGANFFSRGVIDAINQSYAVFCTSPNAIVLTPRLRRVAVTPDMLDAALGVPCGTQHQGHTPDLVILEGTR